MKKSPNNNSSENVSKTDNPTKSTSKKNSHSCRCGCCHQEHSCEDENSCLDEEQDFGLDAIFEPDFQINMKDFMQQFDKESLLTKSIKDLKAQYKNDPECAIPLTESYLYRAIFFQETGEDKKSVADYKSAIKILKTLLEQDAKDLKAHRQLGLIHLSFGTLFNSQENWKKSLDQYELAKEHFKVCQKKGDVESELDLIGADLNIIGVYIEQNDNTNALKLCNQVIKKFRTFAEKETEFRDNALFYLTKSLQHKGTILDNLDEIENDSNEKPQDEAKCSKYSLDSQNCWQEATDIVRKLVANGHEEYQQELAESIFGLSFKINDPEKAILLIDEASELFSRFLDDEESDSILHELKFSKAKQLAKLQRNKESLKLFNELVKTYINFTNNSEDTIFYSRLALIYEHRFIVQTTLKKQLDDLTSAIKIRTELNNSFLKQMAKEHGMPNTMEFISLIGQTFNDSQTFEEISYVFENVSQILSDRYQKANLYNKSNDRQNALNECNEALELLKSFPKEIELLFNDFLNVFKEKQAFIQQADLQ